MKKNKGITLIALIITIIVMLILVAVSVNILIKSNLIGTAEKATNAYKTATEEEVNGGKIKIGDIEYDSIDEYINRNNLQLKYKADNGKVRVYVKDSLYDYVDKLPMSEKNNFCSKYYGGTFEDIRDNFIQKQCEGDTQKFITEVNAINYEDATNMLYIIALQESVDNEEALQEITEIAKTIYAKTVNLTFKDTTSKLEPTGNVYVIKKNGTYIFTAKSEDGKTGELEIQTNFEEGTFKIDIEDVGVREYTFIKGLTWSELISDKVTFAGGRKEVMPDGVELWLSQDNIPFVVIDNVNYDWAINKGDLIVDGNTYTATKH